MRVDRQSFRQREERIAYLVRHFRTFLGRSVLDIGCSGSPLRKLVPEVSYLGVDIEGQPDIRLDLESVERLPFEDGSFDSVVCTDVLEHVDNLHVVFQELLRVSRENVIISLPNNWVTARVPIERGRGSFKFYGLPLDPPPDRHKWFFCYADARTFVHEHARRNGLTVAAERVTEKPKFAPLRWLRRLRYWSQDRYLNRYCHTYWSVLARSSITQAVQQANSAKAAAQAVEK
jgi:SAM-dependent methyltransferase